MDFDRETETLNRDAEEKQRLKRAAELDDSKDSRSKRRKEQGKPPKEERPLAVGAHGVARQDGLDTGGRASPAARTKPDSGSSSPLSPPSQLQSPMIDSGQPATTGAARRGSSSSSSSEEDHQPAPAASIPQYQTFGTNPLKFDDPTIYHVRDVTEDMTDDEKKEIYCVAVFPHSDLKELTAGTPPDRDFSSAKPSNQVAATTFQAYLEPYMRPFMEEDITFLKDRGDRGDIFTVNPRGTRHYKEIWQEEDNAMALDRDSGKLPPNQARGELGMITDDVAQTDQVSLGPISERVLALMKSERKAATEDKDGDNAMDGLNGDGLDLQTGPGEDAEQSASHFAESNRSDWKLPTSKVDYGGMDERLKNELRYIGFLGQEDEPGFDGHWDDEVAERIRVLQTELRRVSIENGARKALLLDKVKEHMAHQEFSTIQEDLDGQIVQAFLKRNRTLNKPSKNKKRPGGSAALATLGSGVSKPGIGDVARTLIDRRRRWMETLQGIFDEDFTKVKSDADRLFGDDFMKEKMKAEEENWDEDTELGV